MKEDKAKEPLLDGLKELRKRVAELEALETLHKRAEEELKGEKERAQGYLHIAGVMLATVDADENITLINKKGCEILGYNEGELIGRNWFDTLVPQRIRGQVRDVFRKLMAGDIEPVEYSENPLLTKNGEERLISFHNTVIRDSNGQIVGVLTSGEDLTEHKQAEDALKESEQKYKTLTVNSLTGIHIHQYGKFVFVNDRFAQMHGYKREELLGRHYLTLVHPDHRELVEQRASQRLKGEAVPQCYEVQKFREDGETIWCEIMVTRIQYRGKPAVMGNTIDITDRKRAEEALRESEEKYRTLFENANNAIFISDTKTNIILDANRKAEQLIGHSREEIIGMNRSKLHPPHQAEYYGEIFSKHAQKGRVFDLEAEVITKDGAIVPVFISASVISLDGKEVIQGLFRDISEERKILELNEEIAARKVIEKAKGLLIDRHKISEKEAMRRLQKESRRQSKKIKKIAQGIISSESILK